MLPRVIFFASSAPPHHSSRIALFPLPLLDDGPVSRSCSHPEPSNKFDGCPFATTQCRMQRRLTEAVASLAAAAAVLCVVAVGRGATARSTELADVRALRPALLCGPSCRRAARLGCFCRLLWTGSRARGAACVCCVLTHGGCRCPSPATPFRRSMVAPASTRRCSRATPPHRPVACSRWRRRASRACSLCTADAATACESPVPLPFRGDRPSRANVPRACLSKAS